VVYKCSSYYSPDDERSVHWSDGDVAIDWPISDAIVSPRDAAAPPLRDVLPAWLPPLLR
jgi:dTDP-4-dehydrorhamnose 3,5-epimerase